MTIISSSQTVNKHDAERGRLQVVSRPQGSANHRAKHRPVPVEVNWILKTDHNQPCLRGTYASARLRRLAEAANLQGGLGEEVLLNLQRKPCKDKTCPRPRGVHCRGTLDGSSLGQAIKDCWLRDVKGLQRCH